LVFLLLPLQLYRILERHLTSTGVALVAMQRGSEHTAGERVSEKSVLFVHTVVASPNATEGLAGGAMGTSKGATTVVRVAKRAIM
jgi:hypothetical protein